MSEPLVLLTALIVDNPMCLDCLAERAAMRPDAVATALTVIERVLPVQRTVGPCPSCRVVGTVYVLERPKSPGPRR
jgi:hypothetical protein